MPILCLDTTTKVASVAVVRGDRVLCELSLGLVENHAARLLPLIDFALREAQVVRTEIASIAVSAGPGSFTGLRIGLSLAKGLAEGLNVPLVLVSTLELLAWQLGLHQGVVIPILDAQRQAYYAAAFDIQLGKVTRLSSDIVVPKDEFAGWVLSFAKEVFLTGEAAPLVESTPHFHLAPSFLHSPRAAVLAFLSKERQFSDPKIALPNYIRHSSAQPKRGV